MYKVRAQMWRWLSTTLLLFVISGCEAPPRDPNVPRTISATDGATGTITVTYQGDWVAIVASDSAINLANSGEAMRGFENDITQLEGDQVAGSVTAILKSALPDTVENSPVGVVRFVTGRLASQTVGVQYTFGLPVTTTIGDRAVAYSDGLATDANDLADLTDDVALDLRMMVIDAGDVYGMIFFGAPFTTLEPSYPIWERIAESFTFTAGQPEQ